jgi:hypothetical protein
MDYRVLLKKYLKGNLSKEEEVHLYQWYLNADSEAELI